MSSSGNFSFGMSFSLLISLLLIFDIFILLTFNLELPEIFKWRNPIESGLALLSINLIYISCLAQNLGLIYVLTNYIFWFAVSAAVYIKIKSIISGGAHAS